MSLEEDARRALDDRDAAERAEKERVRLGQLSVEAELRPILKPLALEFAQAARKGRLFGPRKWYAKVEYNYHENGEGYISRGEANVVIFRNGTFTVSAPTAGYGHTDVDERFVRMSLTRVLAAVLDAKD